MFLACFQVVTSVLEALKNNEHPYHNHGVEVRLRSSRVHASTEAVDMWKPRTYVCDSETALNKQSMPSTCRLCVDSLLSDGRLSSSQHILNGDNVLARAYSVDGREERGKTDVGHV